MSSRNHNRRSKERAVRHARQNVINVEHDDQILGRQTSPLTIERSIALTDGQHWRAEATRADGSPIHVIVHRDGSPCDCAAP